MIRSFDEVITRAMDDFEFSREMRYYDGSIHATIGNSSWVARFEDGKLVSVTETDNDPADAAIWIRGTEEQWANLTAEVPPPFHQTLQSTAVRHGMELCNSNQLFAYLPALNRLVEIYRRMNVETAH